jgi:hypothetical protein
VTVRGKSGFKESPHHKSCELFANTNRRVTEFFTYPEMEPSNNVNFNGFRREAHTREYFKTMSIEMKLWLHPQIKKGRERDIGYRSVATWIVQGVQG